MHHQWAFGLAYRVTEPLLTCEAVLAETAFHLQDVSAVLKLIEDGLASDVFDLADLCLIRLSELNPHYPVITIDRGEFSIHRKNKREMIPLICPT